MKDECLICKAPLEYLVQDEIMECAICHKKELSKTRCVKGHYVCGECHTEGMDSIFEFCCLHQNIETKTLDKLCLVLSCSLEDIAEFVPNVKEDNE